MGKIKCFFHNLSLRKSIACYILAFALTAVALSAVTAYFCNAAVEKIVRSYPPAGEKYYLTNEKGEQLGEGAYISTHPESMDLEDEKLISLLNVIPIVSTPLYSAFCVLAAAFLFYRNKLKKPLELLREASEKISKSDLDFSVGYQSKDELGQLCRSFETMRSALAKNYSQLWRRMEERKRLNAAFAHDLRTPLTVLKGYNEILENSKDLQAKDIVTVMSKHIIRLERYVDSMSQLRRIEDVTPEYQTVLLREYSSALKQSAVLICSRHTIELQFEDHTDTEKMVFDPEIASQIFENLLSNAIRYASSLVAVSVWQADGNFAFSITDDGGGFSQNALKNAASPYYTEANEHSEHFGLGLYICKTLTERHGGSLQIKNADHGGCVTAFLNCFPSQTIDKK